MLNGSQIEEECLKIKQVCFDSFGPDINTDSLDWFVDELLHKSSPKKRIFPIIGNTWLIQAQPIYPRIIGADEDILMQKLAPYVSELAKVEDKKCIIKMTSLYKNLELLLENMRNLQDVYKTDANDFVDLTSFQKAIGLVEKDKIEFALYQPKGTPVWEHHPY